MSSPPSPARIGLFVLIGIFLAVATVLYVGATRLWDRDETFVIFFRESVNGLSVGSPVKFKGVSIGSVADIRLSYNQDESMEGTYIPVFLRIRESRVRGEEDGANPLEISSREDVKRQIEAGLRGRLELESFITGQLFVELDYFAEPGEPFQLVQKQSGLREIPSTPSMMAELGSSAADVLAQLGALDVRTISSELIRLLQTSRKTLDQLDVPAWNASIEGAGRSVQETLAELELSATIQRLDTVLDNLASVTGELDQNLPGTIEDFRAVAQDLTGVVARSQSAMENLEALTEPDAALQQELYDTFRDLRRAAQSARELMNYLERNPRALLTGREDQP